MHVFGAFYLDAFSSMLSPSFRTLRFVWEILRKEKYVCDDPPISKKTCLVVQKGAGSRTNQGLGNKTSNFFFRNGIPNSHKSHKIFMRRSVDFEKKCVFGGKKGRDPGQTKDLETRHKTSSLGMKFWTSGGARQLSSPPRARRPLRPGLFCG